MCLRNLFCAGALLIPAGAFAATDFTYCSLPGELVSEDASGDAMLPVPGAGLDVLTVHIAELADDPDNLYFTLKIDRPSQAATPQTRYYVNFTTPDGVARFVRYTPYPVPGAENAFGGADQMFSVGHIQDGSSVTDAPAEAASSATADGNITIAVKTRLLGRLGAGDVISDIEGETAIYYVAGRAAADTSNALGAYQLQGSDSCKSRKAAEAKSEIVSDKSATSFGGALAPALLLLLGLTGLRRRLS